MSEEAQVAVALLLGTADDAEELRDAASGDGVRVVYESTIDNCAASELLATSPDVVLLNLPAALDEQSPLLEELAAVPGLRFIFNDASITSALEGWDRARWKRHLRSKLLNRPDDLPPRPESALTLRLPKYPVRDGATREAVTSLAPDSEQTLAAEMNSSLAQLADTGSGPPGQHDWSAELDDQGGTGVTLDSADVEGVGQEAMATLDVGDRVEIDSGDDQLELNEDERALLSQMDQAEADGTLSPPLTTEFDEGVRDPHFDQSIEPPVHVDDLPANDQDGTLGEADEGLREFEEPTSDDDTEAEKLDPPQGFAELSLAPIDHDYSAADAGANAPASVAARDEEDAADADEVDEDASGLRLESLDGNNAPRTGRASYLIDTEDRFQVDLRDGVSGSAGRADDVSGVTADPREVSVWALLGDAGSEGNMLEFLGALPSQLPVSFVVLQGDDNNNNDSLPLEPWQTGSGLALEEALTFDCSQALALDVAGRRIDVADRPTGIDGALDELSRHFRKHLGLILFAGSSAAGSDGVRAVHSAAGCVWSAMAVDSNSPRDARAVELDAVAERAGPAELAVRLAALHA